MKEHQTSRTLLKSPPELWAECSDAQSLAKHLGESVGEIRITKLEPEHTVAWEGNRASGTVKLESSGWGTRVTLTCSTAAGDGSTPEPEEAAPEPEAAAPEPEAAAPEPDRAAPEPDADRPPEPEPAPPAQEATSESALTQRSRGTLFTRMMRFLAPQGPGTEPVAPTPERSAPEPVTPEPTTPPPPTPDPPPAATPSPEPVPRAPADTSETANTLAAALDSLGQAHHRPFSRA